MLKRCINYAQHRRARSSYQKEVSFIQAVSHGCITSPTRNFQVFNFWNLDFSEKTPERKARQGSSSPRIIIKGKAKTRHPPVRPGIKTQYPGNSFLFVKRSNISSDHHNSRACDRRDSRASCPFEAEEAHDASSLSPSFPYDLFPFS